MLVAHSNVAMSNRPEVSSVEKFLFLSLLQLLFAGVNKDKRIADFRQSSFFQYRAHFSNLCFISASSVQFRNSAYTLPGLASIDF